MQHDLFDLRGIFIVLSLTQTPSAAADDDRNEHSRHRRLLETRLANLTKEVLFVFIDDGKGVGFVFCSSIGTAFPVPTVTCLV